VPGPARRSGIARRSKKKARGLFTAFSLFDADAGTTAAVRGKRMTQLAANGAGRKYCVIFTQTPGSVPLNTPPILHHSRLRPDLAHPPRATVENVREHRQASFPKVLIIKVMVLSPPRPGRRPHRLLSVVSPSSSARTSMLELATVAALGSADNNTAHRGGAGSNERQVESLSGMTLPAAPAADHPQDVRGPSAATGAQTSHDSAIPGLYDLFQNGVQSTHEAMLGAFQHGSASGFAYSQMQKKNEMDRQKNELEQRNSERISELEQRNSKRISELNSELERVRVAEQQKNNDLRIELNLARVAEQQKEDEFESLEQTTNELQHLNNTRKDRIEVLQNTMNEKQHLNYRLKERIDVLQNEVFQNERQSREDQRAYDQLEADNNAKQEEIADLQRLCAERDEEIAGLEIDKVDLEDEVDRKNDRINELEDHLDAVAYHREDPSGAILIDCD